MNNLTQSSFPTFTRVLLVNFESKTGEQVTYQLPGSMSLDSLILKLARSGQLPNLTYTSHQKSWIRGWCEAIDGEF